MQQAMDRQLEEANAHWDEERKTITHHADQTNKVSLSNLVMYVCIFCMLNLILESCIICV